MEKILSIIVGLGIMLICIGVTALSMFVDELDREYKEKMTNSTDNKED